MTCFGVYLTPLVPLSMIWMYIPIMRGRIKKRGEAPLKRFPFTTVELAYIQKLCRQLNNNEFSRGWVFPYFLKV